MGWKNWSYWLRGGVIGLILGFVLEFGILITAKSCADWSFSTCSILENIINKTILSLAWGVVGIILGIIIGWLYGKIKNRKQEVGK